MGKNIVQKIIDSHLVSGIPEPGNEVGIRIDQTLTQDATGTMAYLQFEALGIKHVQTELSVSYVDHNTVQEGFENADDHAYLQSVAEKYGIYFSKPGNGICHQVHLERFGLPGKTLLGSDSHTPTGGGIGMLAIGAGGLDVAVAMGGGPFYFTYPKVYKIELMGELRPFVSAKDVILEVLAILSTKGNVGVVFEYGGEGVSSLSVPQRATIANMGAETGATCSVFPSDSSTRDFLAAQNRVKGFCPLAPDADAVYDKVITIDLSSLTPRIACPHSPGNVKEVKELAGMKVDQVLVGSCTNASYTDIMQVATLLKGKKIADHVSFGAGTGSRQVLEMVSRNGALADIVEAGARILEPVCGFCIGNSLAPSTNAVSLRTSNRNFYGRSGTTSAQVYLVSPLTAAVSGLNGYITDPAGCELPEHIVDVVVPEKFPVDDSMIFPPHPNSETVEIVRGPNIGAPPSNTPLPNTIAGVITIYCGDKITTDHIMPAGSRLKYRSNIPRYAEFVFEGIDPDFAAKALSTKEKGMRTVIVAGESYGQGSSREHAAICPMYLGVSLVVAKSIERIHRANLINFGIIPFVFDNPQDYEANCAVGDMLSMKNIRDSIANSSYFVLKNETNGADIVLRGDFTEREKRILLAGGLINATRKQ